MNPVSCGYGVSFHRPWKERRGLADIRYIGPTNFNLKYWKPFKICPLHNLAIQTGTIALSYGEYLLFQYQYPAALLIYTEFLPHAVQSQ